MSSETAVQPDLIKEYRPEPARLWVEYFFSQSIHNGDTVHTCVCKLHSFVEGALHGNTLCTTRVVTSFDSEDLLAKAEKVMQAEIGFYGFCGGLNKSFALQPKAPELELWEQRNLFIMPINYSHCQTLGADSMRTRPVGMKD